MRKKILYPLVGFFGVFTFHVIYSIWKGIQSCKQSVQMGDTTLLSLYLEQKDYFLSFSYALAGAFTIYALLKFSKNRMCGVAGLAGGVTWIGILYIVGCFLFGCCGSPMLTVYLSLFGSSFLGFTKPLVLILTITSIVIGYFWMEKKTAKGCCPENEECKDTAGLISNEPIEQIHSELSKGMSLAKCRKCGCMKEVLENLCASFSLLQTKGSSDLLKNLKSWLSQMEPIKYACLGCKHCFPAVATNIFIRAFPEGAGTQPLSCEFEVSKQTWPPVAGEYFAFCDGPSCPVAVSTLASVELVEALANNRPRELCIVGKTETENIGIDKVIKNTITNPTIRVLLLTGKDPEGHHSGRTLSTLWENGVNENMRVIGSPGRRPVLRNVTREEVEIFRKQVKVVDMIGCEDVETIVERVKELSKDAGFLHSFQKFDKELEAVQTSTVQKICAKEPTKVEMDKAGYFVIIPQLEKGIITVEHYSYDNKLERIIKGKDAKSIYWTIIENGWVTQLSHSAYLGKELAKAELSIKMGFKYVQDGA